MTINVFHIGSLICQEYSYSINLIAIVFLCLLFLLFLQKELNAPVMHEDSLPYEQQPRRSQSAAQGRLLDR